MLASRSGASPQRRHKSRNPRISQTRSNAAKTPVFDLSSTHASRIARMAGTSLNDVNPGFSRSLASQRSGSSG